jgi:hypothetical protein
VPEDRLPLGADDPTMYLGDAARLLGVTPAAVRKAVAAQRPSIRGLAPHSDYNPTGKWAVSVLDVEAEMRRRGRAPQAEDLSVADMRLQMVQGEFVDALRAQLSEKDARIELLERLLSERDVRLAERDEEIGRLRRRVRALAEVDAIS